MIYQVECNNRHIALYANYDEATSSIPGVKDGKGNWIAANAREIDGKDVWCITVDGHRMLPRNQALKYFFHHKYAGLSSGEATAKVPRAILLSLTMADRGFMSKHAGESAFDVAHACINGYVFEDKVVPAPQSIDGHYLEHTLSPEAHQALERLRTRGYADNSLEIIERALVEAAGRG